MQEYWAGVRGSKVRDQPQGRQDLWEEVYEVLLYTDLILAFGRLTQNSIIEKVSSLGPAVTSNFQTQLGFLLPVSTLCCLKKMLIGFSGSLVNNGDSE